jgi:hypothetical protein
MPIPCKSIIRAFQYFSCRYKPSSQRTKKLIGPRSREFSVMSDKAIRQRKSLTRTTGTFTMAAVLLLGRVVSAQQPAPSADDSKARIDQLEREVRSGAVCHDSLEFSARIIASWYWEVLEQS